ncbi:MAG: hypothetical protein Fur0041_07970 [Bacteroidia bacterium]
MAHIGMKEALFLLYVSLFKGHIAVKTHDGAGFFIRILIRLRLAKGFYSVRDPRDALLSAMDHARKGRTTQQPSASDKAFAVFHSGDDLYPALQMHFQRFLSWKKFGKCIFPRYEDVIDKETDTIQTLCDYTGIQPAKKNIAEIASDFIRNKEHTPNFNKGLKSRYSSEMSVEEIKETELQLKNCILEMGYTISTHE